MLWDRDLLWAKAKLYFDRAIEADREEEVYAFWCALGFEFLLRSAVAFRAPALLADLRDWKNVLYATDGTILPGHRVLSRATRDVLVVCKALIPDVDASTWEFCDTLIHKRNEELHTGASALGDLGMTLDEWRKRMFRACAPLVRFQEQSLKDLLGDHEGAYAESVIAARDSEIRKEVLDRVSDHRKKYESLSEKEKKNREHLAAVNYTALRRKNHHEVECPACKRRALVSGMSFVSREPELNWDEIVERQEAIAQQLECQNCGLKLSTFDELLAAAVPTKYIRTIRHDPATYFSIPSHPLDDYDREGYPDEYDNE